MKKTILRASLAGCLLALSQGVWADSFVLSDVQIQGLERVPAGTVLSKVPVRVGQTFDDRMAPEVIRSLYSTGFFEDVKISRRGNNLVVNVVERSIIGGINISGNRQIEQEALLNALKQAGLSRGRPMNKASLAKIEQEIKQQYLGLGKYAADVSTDIQKLSDNRSQINIKIVEGDLTKVSGIRITGNKAFSDNVLLRQFESGKSSRLSFLGGKKNKYSKEQLQADVDKLTDFYRDRGYINFKVLSSQASLAENKQSVVVDIKVDEGDQYRIGKIDLTGNSKLSNEELKRLIVLKEGQIFSQNALVKSRKNIQKRLGTDGYASARVGVLPRFDNVRKVVNLAMQIEQGQRVYVRRINIRGNYRTKDEVFRREMRQFESAFFSRDKLEQSKRRIERLPYVESAQVTTSPVAGRGDQLDVDVTVKESASNEFNATAGFSQSNGVLFSVGVKQNNFMGTGKSLQVGAERSDSTNRFNLAYNNPYHTVDGIGRGFNVYYDDRDASEDNVSDYQTKKYGASVNYSIPLSDDRSFRFSLGAEHLEIESDAGVPFIDNFLGDPNNGDGDGKYNNILGTVSYLHDTRDRSLNPTSGVRQNFSLEVGLPGGDLTYYKARYRGAAYKALSDNVTFALKGGLSYGDAYGDTTELPFFERFYSGGISTVRGFESNSLGPRDSVNNDPAGGAFTTNLTAELNFPVPFAKENKGLRMSAFVDAGQVFEDFDAFEADEIRYSAGVGLSWMSPLGPLTVSYAKPLNSKAGDEEQIIQFSIGTSF